MVFNHPTETSKKWVRVPLINLLLIMINVTLSWTKWPYAIYIHLTQTESVFCIYICKLVMIPVTVHIFSFPLICLLQHSANSQPRHWSLITIICQVSGLLHECGCVYWTRPTDPIRILCKQVKFEYWGFNKQQLYNTLKLVLFKFNNQIILNFFIPRANFLRCKYIRPVGVLHFSLAFTSFN